MLACTHPHVLAYDPAFAYEVAVLLEEGIRRMYVEQEPVCYYLTVGNEPYAMPSMPEDAREGILQGAYAFHRTSRKKATEKVKLLGSGAIMNEVLEAQRMLHEDYGVESEAWCVTSYQQLQRRGLDDERWNRLNPQKKPRRPYVAECFGNDPDQIVVAASDYQKMLPLMIRPWVAGSLIALGTDGFGLSEGRESLRDYFEVDARHVCWAALVELERQDRLDASLLKKAAKELKIDPAKPAPESA